MADHVGQEHPLAGARVEDGYQLLVYAFLVPAEVYAYDLLDQFHVAREGWVKPLRQFVAFHAGMLIYLVD